MQYPVPHSSLLNLTLSTWQIYSRSSSAAQAEPPIICITMEDLPNNDSSSVGKEEETTPKVYVYSSSNENLLPPKLKGSYIINMPPEDCLVSLRNSDILFSIDLQCWQHQIIQKGL